MAEVVRVANALMAGGCVAVWTANTIHAWRAWTWHHRRVSLAVSALLLVLAYGNGQAATEDVPLYGRTVLLGISLACLLGALLWGRNAAVDR